MNSGTVHDEQRILNISLITESFELYHIQFGIVTIHRSTVDFIVYHSDLAHRCDDENIPWSNRSWSHVRTWYTLWKTSFGSRWNIESHLVDKDERPLCIFKCYPIESLRIIVPYIRRVSTVSSLWYRCSAFKSIVKFRKTPIYSA